MDHKMHLLLMYLLMEHQLDGVWSSTIPTDESPMDTCNSCCQGPAGLPGVPGAAGAGVPGNNGLPGRDGRDGIKGDAGSKGDSGEQGERGESGLPGPEGPSGERGLQGLGLPGKVGPRGIDGRDGSDGQDGSEGAPGPVGSPGLDGVKGQRGSPGLGGVKGQGGSPGLGGVKGQRGSPGLDGMKGQKGDTASQRRSAFSVAKTGLQTGNKGDILTFNIVETNIGGHYDTSTHKFTCQIPGTYVFMFTIASVHSSHAPYVHLMKDGAIKALAIVRETDSGGSMYLQASQQVVLQLEAGNQVWLQFGSTGEQIFGEPPRPNNFSGFLLYEE